MFLLVFAESTFVNSFHTALDVRIVKIRRNVVPLIITPSIAR